MAFHHARMCVCVCVFSATDPPLMLWYLFAQFQPSPPPCCLTAPHSPVCSLSLPQGLHGSLKPKQAPALIAKPDAQAPSRLGPVPGQNEQWSCWGGPSRQHQTVGGLGSPGGQGQTRGNPIPDTWRSFAGGTKSVTGSKRTQRGGREAGLG